MKTHEKIKFMRQSKHLTQGEVAEKLGMSLKGYSNIECGKTDLKESRIEQIAEALNVNKDELLQFGNKNTYHQTVKMVKDDAIGQQNIINSIDCKTQVEKLELIIEQKDKQIFLLEKQVEDLRLMLDYFRKQV
jgi:transcriptional regulator with XRE-family HTH domain